MENKNKKLTVNTQLSKSELSGASFNKMVSDYDGFFSKSQGAFKGIKKTFSPRDGFEVDPNYTTNTKVVTTVNEKFDWFNQGFKEYLDTLMSVEATNSNGAERIELVVDGVSFGNLTALELMRLRGILTSKTLDNMYNKIPVREDSVVWKPTTDGEYVGRDIFETEILTGQTRTGESEEVILKDPNIDPQHLPSNYNAKTTTKRRQVVTGDYTVQKFTGEWTHAQRANLLRRKSQLIQAITVALKEINSIEARETNLDVDKMISFLTYGDESKK